RGIYTREDGVLQAAPAPRFSATPAGQPGPIPRRGEHQDSVLGDWLPNQLKPASHVNGTHP
ncbi:MAG: CoA transferase, partial [Paraburkholderia nemoris]